MAAASSVEGSVVVKIRGSVVTDMVTVCRVTNVQRMSSLKRRTRVGNDLERVVKIV